MTWPTALPLRRICAEWLPAAEPNFEPLATPTEPDSVSERSMELTKLMTELQTSESTPA